MPEDTKEQRADYVRGLLRERAAAVAHGRDEDVEGIDAELSRMGHEAKPPSRRAEKREEKKAPADAPAPKHEKKG